MIIGIIMIIIVIMIVIIALAFMRNKKCDSNSNKSLMRKVWFS